MPTSLSTLIISPTAIPNPVLAKSSVSFTANDVGGKGPYKVSWTFGDGSTSTATNPKHSYAKIGTYTAKITVTDSSSPKQEALGSLVVSVVSTLVPNATPSQSASPQSCVAPIYTKNAVSSGDLPHTWTSSYTAYDNGKMDGFLQASNDNSESMDYYNASTIPYIWNFSEDYTLQDMMFSSARSYSQPNHWFMIAGQAPPISLLESGPQDKSQCLASNQTITWSTCIYLDEANGIVANGDNQIIGNTGAIQTMPDLLAANGLTWKYYDIPLKTSTSFTQAIKGGTSVYAYWNPLLALNSSYQSSMTSSLAPRSQFFSDLSSGHLPDVSWVIPSAPISDHPPDNITLGEWWIDDVVSSVMQSQYWNSTAIFLQWDDYGGFFDTIIPPVNSYAQTLDGMPIGDSFRVPSIVISPYARAGYVDNGAYDFESTLAFIEWNWHLPALTLTDEHALPMLNSFNFSQTPLRPKFILLTSKQLATITPYIDIGTNSNPPPLGLTIGSSGLTHETSQQANRAQQASINASNSFIAGDDD
jgi:phospholipase C